MLVFTIFLFVAHALLVTQGVRHVGVHNLSLSQVRTLNVYYNNRSVQAIVELKNR